MTLSPKLVVPTDRRFLNRETACADLLSAVNADSQYTERIRVVDRQNSLALLHYINTWSSEEDHTIDEEPLQNIGHVRGTVVNTLTGKVVCKSYPYTAEVVSSDVQRLEKLLPHDLSTVSFSYACEGTVVRVFCVDDVWYMSTHRKIDANNSYWAGPTFGSMFNQVCKFSFDDLNKDFCHVFLLSHDGNRLVYQIPEPQLMLITVYSQREERFLRPDEYTVPTGCTVPTPVTGINTIADLVAIVEHADNSYNSAGILAISDMNNPCPIKIINNSYNSLRNARGNDPSLRSRYIQLRGSPEGSLMVNWYNFDTEYQKVFVSAEEEINDLVGRLHAMYINRYIKKDFSNLPKEEFVTLQRCHSWHHEDRKQNIVTAEKVTEFLNSTPNHYLLVMLNRQRREKKAAERAAAAELGNCSDSDNAEPAFD